MTIICGKCKQEMQEVELEKYEFEGGIELENVGAMRCPGGISRLQRHRRRIWSSAQRILNKMLSDSLDQSARAPGHW